MTIDEAIRYCEEVAENYRCERDDAADINDVGTASHFQQCANDHEQLASWLRELKEAKRLLKAAVEDIRKKCICEGKDCDVCINEITCDYDSRFTWRYEAEALKLIGER